MTPTHTRASGWKIVALAMSPAVAFVLMAGCARSNTAHNNGAKMKVDASLTETAARQRITRYLAETLQALPPGTALSLSPDNPELDTLGDEAAITVPCEDSDLQTGGPEQVQVDYWVVGVPAGQTATYFALVRNIWAGRGYRLQSNADNLWAPVHTPDGYELVAQYVPTKDHSLSIGAGSPCIRKANLGTTTPQPSKLGRPS